MASKFKTDGPHGDGASPGKIFIGGLPKDTTNTIFIKHFGKYGEITDSVIMKDRYSGQPRGFGFITYADPSVVDEVIEDTHVINGKQVEIKRTIPKGAAQTKDFKTKKIFVGGIPSSVSEDEFRSFFSQFGTVTEHQIIRDHETNRSRGFGFIVFDNEEAVDGLLSKGNMIDMDGNQVEIKKAEPKKPTNHSVAPPYGSNSRNRSYGDGYAGYGGSYGAFDGGYGAGNNYRMSGGVAGRLGYGSYGSGGEYGRGYGSFGSGSLGAYGGDSSLGYSSRFGPYAAGFSGAYSGGSLSGYGGSEGYGSYGASGYGSSYDSGASGGYGGASGFYGKGGYSGNSRYHPYAR